MTNREDILALNAGHVLYRKGKTRKRLLMPRFNFVCEDCKRDTEDFDELMIVTETGTHSFKKQCVDCYVAEWET